MFNVVSKNNNVVAVLFSSTERKEVVPVLSVGDCMVKKQSQKEPGHMFKYIMSLFETIIYSDVIMQLPCPFDKTDIIWRDRSP